VLPRNPDAPSVLVVECTANDCTEDEGRRRKPVAVELPISRPPIAEAPMAIVIAITAAPFEAPAIIAISIPVLNGEEFSLT
jgi:hypothetical protein